MDDVIFAGTAARASRNIAEVTLFLDETAGVVPPPFHEQAELQISRQIERGSGSTYRVNGQEVRARDVQTLFADLASGARASGMVSQGRVGALVAARPEDRRAVLEEAAGITGLHARRHEAELKLRAAEANLARAEDLRGQLETQLAGLKRQARQASRYRNISGAIRSAEAGSAVDPARPGGSGASGGAGRAAGRRRRRWPRRPRPPPRRAPMPPTPQQRCRRCATPKRLPAPVWNATASCRSNWRRRRGGRGPHWPMRCGGWSNCAATWGTRSNCAAMPRRRNNGWAPRPRPWRRRMPATRARAEAAAAEAAEAAEAVRRGRSRYQPRDRGRGGGECAGADRLADAVAGRATVAAGGRAIRRGCRKSAAGSAPSRSIRRGWTRRSGNRRRPRRRWRSSATLWSKSSKCGRRPRRRWRRRGRRSPAADSTRAKLAAEAQALAEVLAVKDGERWPPMVDALVVPDGLETALGAALGEELTSALDPDAARHWRELPAFDPPPAFAGRRGCVGFPGAGAAGAGAGLVADWSGGRRGDGRSAAVRFGAGPGIGLT